jgi:nicotinamide-nucleotide amidase
MLDRNTFTGTAFCITEEDLRSVFAGFHEPGINLRIKHEKNRLIFEIIGEKTIQQQNAFEYLAEACGVSRIRQGKAEPAQLAFLALRRAGARLVTAESCTGGLIAKLITDIPGSSEVFWGGFTVYSDEAKQKMLLIDSALLAEAGAVSAEVVKALAEGALRVAGTDFSLAVSGIAGPGGGSVRKPVGTVWLCVTDKTGKAVCLEYHFSGSREDVRYKTATCAFLILEALIIGGDYLDYSKNW